MPSAPLKCKTTPQRILLADDEPLILQLNSTVLVESGYEVDTANDGADAWEVLQLKNYHLLITDNDMPRMTGVELVKKVHAARMALPVIMATGTFPEDELSRHPWLQIEATLLKPYSIEELLITVGNVLRVSDGCLEQSAPPPNRQSQPSSNGLRM